MIFHPDDLQGVHQLLLFLGEGAQLFLHPRKERGLDGQPGGCEELSEPAHLLLDSCDPAWQYTSC